MGINAVQMHTLLATFTNLRLINLSNYESIPVLSL